MDRMKSSSILGLPGIWHSPLFLFQADILPISFDAYKVKTDKRKKTAVVVKRLAVDYVFSMKEPKNISKDILCEY